MNRKPSSKIIGTGRAVPEKELTNFDLEKIVDTSDEWIRTRTGIEVRHIAAEDQYTSDLGSLAANEALKDAGLEAKDLDIIIFATITGDVGFPSTAIFVQKNIGAVNATAFDIQAACSGFIFGLDMADSFISTGRAKNVLVIGGETLSRITDYSDRNTCVLFGDGAGAAIVQASDDDHGILATFTKTDGRLHNLLKMEGMGTKNVPTAENLDKGYQYIEMAGRDVFKHAVTCMGDAAEKILERAELSYDDVDWLIPHQANVRIMDATARRIKLPDEKIYINVNRYGNTSAASIPIALDEMRKDGKLKDGDVAILVAFGGGFTWGSAAIRM